MHGTEIFLSLGLALLAGLLVGFERERAAPLAADERDSFLGGVRTHPLFALLGGVSMLLAHQVGVVMVVLPLLAVIAFLLISYWDDVRRGADRGLTSEAAFLLSYLLGASALADQVVPSLRERTILLLSVAVVVSMLLSIKPALHGFVQQVSRQDLFASLKFLLVAVVVVPLLPDETLGPLDVINPRKVGLLVTLIAGLSFVGYVAMRALGARRGIGLTGLVGGLVSSTAVTLSFSGRAKQEPRLAPSCAMAVVLASAIMFGRVLVEVAVVNRDLVRHVALPMGAMCAAGLLASGLLFHRQRSVSEGADEAGEVALSNPFELSSAVKFALVFMVVLLASKAATIWFGTGAIYLTALLAGTTDVDAITLSMARMAGRETSEPVAVTAILLGAGSNTVVKAGMATMVGGWMFGRIIALVFGVMLVAGAAALVFVWR